MPKLIELLWTIYYNWKLIKVSDSWNIMGTMLIILVILCKLLLFIMLMIYLDINDVIYFFFGLKWCCCFRVIMGFEKVVWKCIRGEFGMWKYWDVYGLKKVKWEIATRKIDYPPWFGNPIYRYIFFSLGALKYRHFFYKKSVRKRCYLRGFFLDWFVMDWEIVYVTAWFPTEA